MQHPAFVRKTYAETLDLLVEARNYLGLAGPSVGRSPIESVVGLRHSCEALRVTARLTSVMAWLMMQRAIQRGEVAEEQALAGAAWLDGDPVCLTEADEPLLPQRLQSLLRRSLLLYVRVSRIEERLRQVA